MAVRRERLIDQQGRSILDFLDLSKYVILPNTAGCFSAEDAVRVALLGRDLLEKQQNPGAELGEAGSSGRQENAAARSRGFAGCHAATGQGGVHRSVLHQRRSDRGAANQGGGAASVMPAGSPIGSGQGVLNPLNISLCLETLKQGDASYPVIVDAGVGTASDVTVAMELGADGVLLNTGVAHAKDPVKMAAAMRQAIEAGRLAYEAGRIAKKRYATASSPFDGVISYIPGE